VTRHDIMINVVTIITIIIITNIIMIIIIMIVIISSSGELTIMCYLRSQYRSVETNREVET
jgi:hypothetical protein